MDKKDSVELIDWGQVDDLVSIPGVFKPSDAAARIHSCIPKQNFKLPNAVFKIGTNFHGRYIHNDHNYGIRDMQETAFFTDENRSNKVEVTGVTFPRLSQAVRVMETLDYCFLTYLRLFKPSEFPLLFALNSVVIGSSHPFLDGNGRVAFAITEYYWRKLINPQFRMRQLLGNRSLEYSKMLYFATLRMMPKPFNAQERLQELATINAFNTVEKIQIPTQLTHSVAEIDIFRNSLTENIKRNIELIYSGQPTLLYDSLMSLKHFTTRDQ